MNETIGKLSIQREVWLDFIRVVGIAWIIVFHLQAGNEIGRIMEKAVGAILIFFLFFMGYFTNWKKPENIFLRWKWVFLSFIVWGIVSAFMGREWGVFGSEWRISMGEGKIYSVAAWLNMLKRMTVLVISGGDNWAFWYMIVMLVFYSVLGGVILLNENGYKKLAGAVSLLLALLFALLYVSKGRTMGLYLPFLGLLMRPVCDLQALTAWMKKKSLIFTVAYFAFCYLNYNGFDNISGPVVEFSGFIAICGLSIWFAQALPRFAGWIASMAPAVFLVFISHMVIINNVAWSLLRISFPASCALAVALLVVLYAVAYVLDSYCPGVLSVINCGNHFRRVK